MKKFFLIVSILLLLFILNQHLSSLDIKTTEELKKLHQKYYQIRKLISEKKYHTAYTKFKDFFVRNLDFYEAYLIFSRCAKKIDELNSAISFFKQLLKKDPKNPNLLYGLGVCYEKQKDFDKAADFYEQAINLQAGYLAVYYRRGFICPDRGLPDLIDYFKHKLESDPANSNLHYALGLIYQYRLKKYEQALKYFKNAVKVARRIRDRSGEGKHLNTLGNCYWGMSNYEKALEYYKKALRVMHLIGDKTEEVKYLGNCGLINWNFGKFKLAMEYYRKALVISREIGDLGGESSNLRSIGYVHARLNQYSQALNCYNQALKIARSYSNKPSEVGYLADIADIYWMRGDYQRALLYNNRALEIFLEVENKNDLGTRYNESKALKGIGNIHWKIGDYAKALEYYIRALEVNRKRVNREKEAQILVDVGNIYNNIGDYSKALEYLKNALEIQREIKVKSAEGVTLGNIGHVYLNQKKYSLSQKYFRQSLKISRELGNNRAEGNRLVGLAIQYLNIGDFQKALNFLNQSLSLAKETDNKDLEAFVLCKKGHLYKGLNNFSDSQKCFSEALTLGESLKSSRIKWDSYSGLGSLNEKQGKYIKALHHYKKSIEVIEKMRSQLKISEFKSGFLENKIRVYESLIDLLVKLHKMRPDAGFDSQSFYFVERAKARAFLDSLKESRTSISQNLSPELREEEIKNVKRISEIQTRLANPDLSDSVRSDLIKKLGNEEEKYQHLILKIKSNNPEYANLVYPKPLTLQSVQKNMQDKKTVLLEYFIGEKNSYLFFISRDQILIHRLSDSKIIQEMVEDYIDLLANIEVKKFRAFAAGKKMFQELIGPVEEELNNIDKVIVVPDGNLHYLPFEALVIPTKTSAIKFLADDKQFSYAPSASALMNLKKRGIQINPRKDFLAFANPVYTFKKKPGIKKKADWIFREFCLEQGFDLSPLQYSGKEVEQIAKLIKKENREIYTGQDAREEILKRILLSDYRIIHFATHGLFDEKVPQRSSIVLTLDEDPREDGFFQVREIYNSKLNSDLVVLSACQTGKGKLEKGEGVSGISRAFLYAGARAVLVSLWNVNDKATSFFMGYFYKYLISGKSIKESLQKTKVKMIKSNFNHPFYWAAFVLIGEGDSPVKIHKPILPGE